MDELNLFRDFRSGVAAPSEAAQRRASTLLAGAGDRRRAPRASAPRLIAKRPGYSALALAALAGATAAALFLSTPWRGSPGFLARAQAALTEDPGTILHAKWDESWTSTDPTCSVERGPNEIWIDQAPPHRLRARLERPAPSGDTPPTARTLVCSNGRLFELHGSAPTGWKFSAVFAGDPVTALRDAISEGRAHDEGATQFHGRTVRRIRVDPPSDCYEACPRPPERSYTYVDPESFYPVAESGFMSLRTDRAGKPPSHARFEVLRRYLTFEYLPRTGANLALVRAP